MSRIHGMSRMVRWTAGGLGLMTVGYATVLGTTWYRYGHIPPASPDERDPLLDRFMPEYEVAERHHVSVAAPAAMTLSAAWYWARFSSGIVLIRRVMLGLLKTEAERRALEK